MAQKLTMKMLSEELEVLHSRVKDMEINMERKLEGALETAADKLKSHIEVSEHAAIRRPMPGPGVGVDERRRLIAEAAYLRAERRGFCNGCPDQDWLEAELEVDWMLLHGWVKNSSIQEERRT